MPFKTLELKKTDDIHVVRVLERRIFLKITDVFREEMIKVMEEGVDRLIIDLTNVSVMNSSGLGVLILTRDKIQKNNGRLILCGLMPVMSEIFARMHLDSFFTIMSDENEALAAIRKDDI